MASAMTVLAWGVDSWPEAYRAAGQLDEVRRAIKWASDYFIKCHVSENALYGQVGDFSIDHTFWGRPEDLNTSRPAYKIDPEHPGTRQNVSSNKTEPFSHIQEIKRLIMLSYM